MISVEEAKKLIIGSTHSLPSESVGLAKACGYALAEDITAPVNLPAFDNSSVDGYAFLYNDYLEKTTLKITGEIAAGDPVHKNIHPGEAIRIYTGAPIPPNADTVVMQEKTSISNDLLHFSNGIKKGDNIRWAGSQVKHGELALPRGTSLNPGSIAYLAALGINRLKVIRRPNISIIVTGNEIQQPGTQSSAGKIYDANSFAIRSALKANHLEDAKLFTCKDDLKALENIFITALASTDLFIFSGGISVGKYDIVRSFFESSEVETIFYKVAQKPGKPLFFGKYKDKYIFGLPGNPAAALTCFYEYVLPAIRLLAGHQKHQLKTLHLPIAAAINSYKDLGQFMKARIDEREVVPLTGQDSSVLKSYAAADALIYVPAEIDFINKGDLVEVHCLT